MPERPLLACECVVCPSHQADVEAQERHCALADALAAAVEQILSVETAADGRALETIRKAEDAARRYREARQGA